MATLLTFLLPLLLMQEVPSEVPTDDVTTILERHLAAVGGEERLSGLTGIRAAGQYSDGSVSFVPFVHTIRPPDYTRFQVGPKSAVLVIAATPAGGWIKGLDGQGRTEAMNSHQVPRQQRSGDFSATHLLRHQRDELTYLGESTLEGTQVHRFHVELEGGESVTYSLDAEKYLLLRVDEVWVIGEQEFQIVRRYGDFRVVDGLTLPHLRVENNPQGERTFKLLKVELDPDLEPGFFELPESLSEAPEFSSESGPESGDGA